MTWFLRFDHFAAAQAGCADSHAFGGGAYTGMHGAQIDVPAPLGDVVGVADAVTELRLFAADITLLCHDCCRSFQGSCSKLLFYRILALADNSRWDDRGPSNHLPRRARSYTKENSALIAPGEIDKENSTIYNSVHGRTHRANTGKRRI
jgi:hypothetical protein